MSVNSMTGFARVQGSEKGNSARAWTWEVRSVNSKGLDIRMRLAVGMESAEQAVRDLAAKRFKRGSISLNLSLANGAEKPALKVNEALLEQLAEASHALRLKFMEKVEAPRIDGLLAVKGVLEPAEDAEDEATVKAREKAILASLDEALTALAEMRAKEGAKLHKVLKGQLSHIADLTNKARALAALQPEALKARLKEQVAALLDASPALPEERLAQEAALLAAKADVREELDRLDAHISAVEALLAKEGPVGRKLDFLCQEFNREANTLCSKSSDRDLTAIGVDLKTVIDQMREQVQNIE